MLTKKFLLDLRKKAEKRKILEIVIPIIGGIKPKKKDDDDDDDSNDTNYDQSLTEWKWT